MREIGFFQSLFLLFKRILYVFLTSFTKNRVIFTMLKNLAVLCGIVRSVLESRTKRQDDVKNVKKLK